MKCQICHYPSRVIRSTAAADGSSIARRRECLKGKHRWTTLEQPNATSLYAKLPSTEGLLFGADARDWHGLSPDEWFHANHPQFLLSLEAIATARAPYRSLNDPPYGEGIYFLFDEGSLLYVGQARIILHRLVAHRYPKGKAQLPATWFTHYTAIWVPRLFLDTVERYYLHLFQPPRNIEYPPLDGPAANYLELVPE